MQNHFHSKPKTKIKQKHWGAISLIFLLLILIGVGTSCSLHWPTSRGKEETMTGVGSAEETHNSPLSQARKSAMLSTDEKVIAITFDDGPNGKTTPKLLDVLKKHDAKATFFLLGKRIKGREKIIKRMAKEGHEIGNHTWDHANLVRCDAETLREQLEKTDKKLRKIGVKPTVFRPPYGNHNEKVDALAKKLGYPVILWSKDTLDWKYRNADTIANRFLRRLKSGDIVLLHDIHASSVEAMDRVLTQLEEEGYRFLTASELVRSRDKGLLEAGKTFE